MKISLKDIAKKVGVSTALVSYVINGKEKEMRVGEEMAAKIREAALELNYQPNQIAKSLKSGKTFTIGFIVADISNSYFANMARIIEDEARRSHYTVIFGSSDENPGKAWNLMTVLLNRQVDGFIISPSEHSEKQIEYLQEKKIPFVLIDRYFPGIETNHVTIANFEAAAQAVEHLIENGYRRIGMINYKTTLYHLQERTRGYEQALAAHQLPPEPVLARHIREDHLKADMQQALDELLALHPPIDAVFFSSNKIAVAGLKRIRELDLRVPQDIAVVGFDETDAYELFYCPVTYVRQPMLELGKQAVQLLLRNILVTSTQEKLDLPTTLVIQASSAPKAG